MRKWSMRLAVALRLRQNTPKMGQKRPCEPRTEVERGNVAWPLPEALRSCSKPDTQQEAEHE